MVDIAKNGIPSLSTALPGPECFISGLYAGEAIAAGDACYINSDGKVWRSVGTTANAAAKVDGFALRAAPSGGPVTIATDVSLNYGSGLTPGARYFASTNPGQLATATTTGGTAAVATAVDATRIHVYQSRY